MLESNINPLISLSVEIKDRHYNIRRQVLYTCGLDRKYNENITKFMGINGNIKDKQDIIKSDDTHFLGSKVVHGDEKFSLVTQKHTKQET